MRLTFDNIVVQVELESRKEQQFFDKVIATLSAKAPGYQYTWRYKHTSWDGTVSFIDTGPKTRGGFPTGYLPTFTSLCHESGILPKFVDNRQIPMPELDATDVPLRDYQWETAKKFLELRFTTDGPWWPRGIARLATGAGKTEVAVALTEMVKRPTTFIVHRERLLAQAVDRYEKYGMKVGVIGDGAFDPEPGGVTVAMIQTLASRLDHKSKNPDAPSSEGFALLGLLGTTEFLIVDEAHGVAADLDKGNLLSQTLAQFRNAYMRLGLTATPFMRDDYSNFLLEGTTGKVFINLGARELIERGWLQDAKITMYEVPALEPALYRMKFGNKKSRYQRQYEVGVVRNTFRNKIIAKSIKEGAGPTVCLVRTKDHGQIIQAELKNLYDLDIPFLCGEDDSPTRDGITRSMVEEKGAIITTLFDVGVDIPEIQTLVLAAGGKSKGAALQKIGRGLRKSKDKTDLNVIDFFDRTGLLGVHSKLREGTWKEEGYEVEVVAATRI